MGDVKNFRITLQLSHFFQDHRSLCKIFVNSKMQYISDLQNHIQNIFNIKNFHFLSAGHYIPPSEDIRILQRDDVILVLPHHNINPPICTSTPVIDVNASPVKGKRKRHLIENENLKDVIPFIQENLAGDEKIKKKKKKKEKRDVYTTKELQILNDDKLNENPCCDVIQNDTAKRKKQMKPQNIFPHFEKNKSEDIKEKDMNSSVKEKVSYFENHSSTNETKNILEDCRAAEEIDTTRQEGFVNKDQSEGQQNSTDDFRKKKLYVRKRSDIISYDLPKKSNIVQSILVSQSSMNERASKIPETAEKVNQTNYVGANSITNGISATTPIKEKLKYSICILKQNSPVSIEKIGCQSRLDEKIEPHFINKTDFNKTKEKETSQFRKYEPECIRNKIFENPKNVIDSDLHRATEKENMRFLDAKLENTTHKESEERTNTDVYNSNGICGDSLNITKEIDKQFSKSIENDLASMNVTSLVKDSIDEPVGDRSKPTENDICNMDVTSLVKDSANELGGGSSKPTGNDFYSMDVTSLVKDSVNEPAGDSSKCTENDLGSMDVTSLVKDSTNEQSSRDSPKPTGGDLCNKDVTTFVTDFDCENVNKSINSFLTDLSILEITSSGRDSDIENAKKVITQPVQFAENTFTNMDVTTLVSDSGHERLNKAESLKVTENDSAISLENNICQPTTAVDAVSLCSEKESFFSDSISSTPSENVQPVKTTSFITKRKRKRSHRKRKTRSSTETTTLVQNNFTEYAKKHIQTTVRPRIHIKFDDDQSIPVDGDDSNMCDILEKQLSDIPLHSVNKIADNDFTLKNERETATNKRSSKPNKLSEAGDCITILDESSDNINRESREFGTTLISEETISKSVLMVSMRPRCGDIIAFKILRLTENYTPDVSKYITGKILRVSENNSDVELKIIEGVDQCTDPDGKFALKNLGPLQKEQINIKTFSWSDLIEPRLIYP